MRRKQLAHRIKSLDTEKKVLAISSLAAIIACFLPWYGINSRVINEWWNAFSSIGSVAGYLVSIFSLLTFALIALPLIKPEWNIEKKLPFKEASLLLFFSAQSCFVSLLFIPVYAQYSLLNASNSGTRFGIYVALISTLVSSVVSIAYQRRVEKNASVQPEFASVPRTQRSINEWDQEETEEPVMETEEMEQETMFQHYEKPVETTYPEMVDQQAETEYQQK